MVKIRLARTGEGQDLSEAARELLVSALENEYGIPAAEVRIEKDEKGKPYLEGYSDLYISISHSGPYIACAFGDKPVGVDTEMWKAHPKWRRIVVKCICGNGKPLTGPVAGQLRRRRKNRWKPSVICGCGRKVF